MLAVQLFGQDSISSDTLSFEKDKWVSSSDYRYEIVKGSKFPSVTNLSENEIIEILGQPDFEADKILTYCLDITAYHGEDKKCLGSFVTINLDKNVPAKYRLTIAWAEKN